MRSWMVMVFCTENKCMYMSYIVGLLALILLMYIVYLRARRAKLHSNSNVHYNFYIALYSTIILYFLSAKASKCTRVTLPNHLCLISRVWICGYQRIRVSAHVLIPCLFLYFNTVSM